ncbi:hypothetical protein ACFX2A_038402 [Malus domestica]
MKASRGSRPSWAWSSLLEGRKIIERGAKWQIGNGQCVKISSDNWLPTPVTSCPKPTTIIVGPIPTMVASLIDSTSLPWRLNEIKHFVSQDDACLIKSIPLYGHLEEDKIFWPWTKDGNYSVKSGYNWMKSHSFSSSRVLKHSSHQTDNKVASNLHCPLCKKFEESIEHIMLLCPWRAFPKAMEMEAAFAGLSLGKELRIKNVIIESDSTEVVDCITKKSVSGMWKVFYMVSEIWRLQLFSQCCQLAMGFKEDK